MAEPGVNLPAKSFGTAVKQVSPMPRPLAEVEFQASKVIERLEEAVEREEAAGGSQGSQTWKTSHGFLPLPSKTKDEILAQLEDLMIHEEGAEEGEGTVLTQLPQFDGPGLLAIVSQSIAAYASSLDRQHLQRLTTRITADTTRWLSHMFRFLDCSAFFHEDMLEGVVRITRMMVHYKYPLYIEEGFEALAGKPPVIYSSVASPLGLVQHICRQLGLPLMCVRPVPCNTVFGSQQKMDVAALERLIEEDMTAERVPLIVLADAGTPVAGHVDNLGRLQEVCRQHDIWLHLRGHSLAALAMASASTVPSRIADSMTLPIGVWLGVPALPVVTLFRQFEPVAQSALAGKEIRGRESTLPLIAGLTVEHFTLRLSCLSLWTSMQALGRSGIQQRLQQAFEASEQLHNKLSKYSCLRLLNQKPGGEAGSISVTELATKPTSTAILFETVACTVVFQFVPEGSQDKVGRVPPYFDKLNSWLGQILQRDAPQVALEICELDSSGVILRFCPLELAAERLPNAKELDQFVFCLDEQLEILSATVQHKETFVKLAEANPRLRLVHMPQWAGLGGVRYVPECFECEEPLPEQVKDELNHLNSRLVEQLRSTDAAFSLGKGTEDLVCVRFGMVTAETDVEELLSLVETVGREVEESSRYLESLTEIVKKGIETATQDLQKENAERIWQEGILRHVPVVGSLVNWWSPLGKESGIKGRSLNLTAGVVESTENIYRYHMQIQGVSPPGTRGPPTPLVQTPIAPPNANLQHSRSSSQASQQSQHQQQQQQQQSQQPPLASSPIAEQPPPAPAVISS